MFPKVLDKLVYDQLRDYVHDNNILYKYQPGYRRSNSTQTPLIRIPDDVQKATDERKLD